MSRTIRTEVYFNEQQAVLAIQQQARSMALQSERDDWRRVLERRDSKRAAPRNAPARAQSGNTLAAVLFSVALGVAGAASLFLMLGA